jgi:hypothetical protein
MLFFAWILIACKNKESKPEYPLNLIAGTWKPVEMLEHKSSD